MARQTSRWLALWNPEAGSVEHYEPLQATLKASNQVKLCVPRTSDELRQELEAAAEGSFDGVLAAGGDGTVHAVVNALSQLKHPPALAILPLGTGNDTARSLSIPLDPSEALSHYMRGGTRPFSVDLLEADTSLGPVRGINTVTGGNSVRVLEGTSSESKSRWGSLAYLQTALSILRDLDVYHGTLAVDDEPELELSVVNLHIGNGRTSTGGVPTAPSADPADGLVDLVVVSPAPVAQLLGSATRHVLGLADGDPHLWTRKVREVRFDFQPELECRIDGEAMKGQVTRVRVLPRALRVHVGPAFRAS